MSSQNTSDPDRRLEILERRSAAWERIIRTIRKLAVELLILLVVLLAAGSYLCNKKTKEKIVTGKIANEDIKKLHEYLNDINKCLLSMQENESDEAKKIAIKNFLEYKQSAIDVFAFKKYPDLNEKLDKSEKQALSAYVEDIKKDLNQNAAEFSLDLSQCK